MTASLIFTDGGSLWVGDASDAMRWKGVRICVLESGILSGEENTIWIPFLEKGCMANHDQLDKIATVVDSLMNANQSFLLHCAAGMERSPLAALWFLHKKRNFSIEDAWKHVKSTRKQALDRRIWLEKNGFSYKAPDFSDDI